MLNDGLLDDDDEEEEEEESKSSDSDRSEAVNDDGHFVEADEFSPDKSLRVGADGGGGGLAEGYQHDEKQQQGGSLGDIMRRLKLEKKQHESSAWNDAVVDVGDVNVNRFPVDEESTAMMSPIKKKATTTVISWRPTSVR
ncbi:Hypothetical protein, putative [Bodo saltans]|uniref:Uncharacterized protein n=1 Tax=Bodo saltans TaxID=75058 RepID=A0A0S4IW11_BODSA|nr:Hypothetical protein, putative [Bodo saltans]|eukprot:CUG03237.1 Hypothetical protein, putative [Bodo saltans]